MLSQLTFICSKSTIKTLEKGVKEVNDENTRTTSMIYFTPFSIVFVVDFEQLNVSWVCFFFCIFAVAFFIT